MLVESCKLAGCQSNKQLAPVIVLTILQCEGPLGGRSVTTQEKRAGRTAKRNGNATSRTSANECRKGSWVERGLNYKESRRLVKAKARLESLPEREVESPALEKNETPRNLAPSQAESRERRINAMQK